MATKATEGAGSRRRATGSLVVMEGEGAPGGAPGAAAAAPELAEVEEITI